MPTVETETEIAAAPEKVWAALSDFSTYPKWNPFREVLGEPRLGAKVTLLIGLDARKRRRLPAHIGVFEPVQAIGFVTGGPFFGKTTETFSIEASRTGTLLRHSTLMTGLTKLVMERKVTAAILRASYEEVDKALGRYCAAAIHNRASRRRGSSTTRR